MKRLMLAAVALAVCGGLVFAAAPAAQAFDLNNPTGAGGICSSGSAGASSGYCQDTSSGGSDQVTGQNGALLKAANLITYFAGIAVIIVIIIGAIRLVASGGDSSSVNGGRSMIMYALIGIVVIVLAQVIIRFVIGRFLTSSS